MPSTPASARRTPALIPLLGLIAILYAVGLAFGIIKDLLKEDRLISFDKAANAFFGPYRHSPLVDIFLWVTTLGTGATITIVVVVASGFLWIGIQRASVGPLWIVFLGLEATVWSTKYLVGRIRPDFIAAASATSPSFPSGHAASSIAIYGFLAYVMASCVAEKPVRVIAALCSGAVIVLIGFSRIFLSLHFVSDVAAGYFIGGFWLLVGVALVRRTRAL